MSLLEYRSRVQKPAVNARLVWMTYAASEHQLTRDSPKFHHEHDAVYLGLDRLTPGVLACRLRDWGMGLAVTSMSSGYLLSLHIPVCR